MAANILELFSYRHYYPHIYIIMFMCWCT